MTSISALSSNSYQSPLQMLQDQLQSEVSAGTVSASDESALSSALTDIDSELRSGSSSDQSSGTQAQPGDLKSKINDLIQNEVTSGKLTSDQATELQGIFQATFAQGPGGAGGPPPGGGSGGLGGLDGPPPGGLDGAESGSGSSSSSSTDSSSDVADLLQQFLQSLQAAQSSSASSYDATGSNSTSSDSSSSISAILINYQA